MGGQNKLIMKKLFKKEILSRNITFSNEQKTRSNVHKVCDSLNAGSTHLAAVCACHTSSCRDEKHRCAASECLGKKHRQIWTNATEKEHQFSMHQSDRSLCEMASMSW